MIDNISRIRPITRRLKELSYPINLELGCGDSKHRLQPTWVGLDIIDYGQEVVWDMEQGLPFPDNSVEKISCSQVLEHLTDLIGVMNECHRVLKENGELQLVVPYFENEHAFIPSHVRQFNKHTIAFFEYTDLERDYFAKPWKVNKIDVDNKKDLYATMVPIKK